MWRVGEGRRERKGNIVMNGRSILASTLGFFFRHSSRHSSHHSGWMPYKLTQLVTRNANKFFAVIVHRRCRHRHRHHCSHRCRLLSSLKWGGRISFHSIRLNGTVSASVALLAVQIDLTIRLTIYSIASVGRWLTNFPWFASFRPPVRSPPHPQPNTTQISQQQ